MQARYLCKGVGSWQHLEATQHCSAWWDGLGVCLGVGVEGLPRHGGPGPGVPLGGVAILFPVAGPEHALSHIPAECRSSQHHWQVFHAVREGGMRRGGKKQ